MTLRIMRHAPTSANAETPGPEKIRGWGGVGLGDEGKAIAAKAADALKGQAPDVIFTSDLPRAHDTAKVLSQQWAGTPVVPLPELRTWNVGDITGKDVKTAKPQLDALQHETPDEKAPGGESYNDFYKRWSTIVEGLKQMSQGHNVLAVVHGRQVYSLPNILAGKGSEGIPTHGAPNPGDVLEVTDNGVSYAHRSGEPPKVTA